MKMKMGQLRRLLREARPRRREEPGPWSKEKAHRSGVPFNEELKAYEDIKVGEWVRTKGQGGIGKSTPSVGQVKSLTRVHPPQGEPYVMVSVGYGDHSGGRRWEYWRDEDYLGPASPEEVEQAKEDWEAERKHMSSVIDTSKQGT